ncbi:hypothetical protein KBD61_02485 [Patescibacteria group bacterium]|nr:hypothetical protein [Patescibacteria group bacterium]MBP9709874.1 hypothetical protein [Patescibacteria group bacterium]
MKGISHVLQGLVVSVFVGGIFFITGFGFVKAMEVKPPILEVRAAGGETAGAVFFLKNTEMVEQTYGFSIQGFVAQGDQGQQTFLSPADTEGLPSWLYLKSPRMTLAPGATVSVPLLLRPPVGTEAGGYQAVVFVSRVDPGQVEGVVLGSRVGVLVFATVEGDVQRSVSIASFQRVSSRLGWWFSPRFEVVLRNEGQAHEIPNGNVRIKNIFGQTKERVSLQTTERVGRILPRSERRFEVEPVKKDGWIEGWGLGIYRAEFFLDEPFTARADGGWFFVIPWKTLTVLGVGIMFVWWRRRRGWRA